MPSISLSHDTIDPSLVTQIDVNLDLLRKRLGVVQRIDRIEGEDGGLHLVGSGLRCLEVELHERYYT